MLDKSVQLAEQKLIAAHEAFEAYKLSNAENKIQAAKRYWTSFLVSINGVFLKLELGTKCCNQCANWLGKYKHQRKTDPLLDYIHHARNSDEHGLDEVVVHAPQSVNFEPATSPSSLPFVLGMNFSGQEEENPEPAKITVGYHDGTTKEVTNLVNQIYFNRQLVLAKAKSSRHPKPIEPPKEHLGKPVSGHLPSEVGSLAISYFEAMVLEAKDLQCDPKTRSTSMAK